MSEKLKGRVALVTGAGRGIGRAIALGFAREGALVAATARTDSELQSLSDEIQAMRGKYCAIAADLIDRTVVASVVNEVRATLGSIDILVNNAGVGSSANPKPLVDFDDDFWDMTIELNLTIPYLLCKAVLPEMIARGKGRIIMTASINGRIGSFHGAAYAASKHGLLGLVRTLALETAKQGITVNAICPGPVRTVMNDKRIDYDAKRLGVDLAKHETTLTPMGRRLEPDEISPMAVYLASDDSTAVTGQAFNICGGLLMS